MQAIMNMEPHELLELGYFQRFVATRPLSLEMPSSMSLVFRNLSSGAERINYTGTHDQKVYFDFSDSREYSKSFIFEYSSLPLKTLAWGLMDCYLKNIKSVTVYTFPFLKDIMNNKDIPSGRRRNILEIWAGCRALERKF